MKQITVSTNAVQEIEFPKSLIVEKVNNTLIAQAVRVYRASARQGNANTKTRGEVAGSTRKIYKQKGTGRARHGSIKAPVFIGGGTVFGPLTHSFDLAMPTTMRRVATKHALNKRIGHLASFSLDSDTLKTAQVATVLKTLVEDTKTILVVLADESLDFRQAVANLSYVHTVPASELNAFDVMRYAHVVVESKAWELLSKRLNTKGTTK